MSNAQFQKKKKKKQNQLSAYTLTRHRHLVQQEPYRFIRSISVFDQTAPLRMVKKIIFLMEQLITFHDNRYSQTNLFTSSHSI